MADSSMSNLAQREKDAFEAWSQSMRELRQETSIERKIVLHGIASEYAKIHQKLGTLRRLT